MIPKFRAWIKSEKRHLPVVMLDFYTGEIVCQDNNQQVSSKLFPQYFLNEIRLEQFTGLKDKNGTEIYEGDKVEFTTEWQSKHQIEVVFDSGQGHFGFGREYEGDLSCIYTDKSLGYFLDATEGGYTVIGHVHESEAK